ncbi:MAG TPA: phosphate ABC transporter substrate-binding protein PstS [Frankiaceae bacterium]|nr:phosphate ABC transporter substrate-binding protein PstS [Frankiaceae bacterium]
MTVGCSTRRWSQYGSAVLAASTLLAVAACGSSSKGSTTSPSSSAPASSAASSTGTTTGGITCNGSGTLTSSGSTAQQNAISAWAKAYQAACKGAVINYGGGGSGKGVTDFTAGTDDFAGSDFPLTTSQKSDADKVCSGGEAVDLPMAPGGIAISYNLSGVSSLNLSAGTIAKIFSGKITTWDDAAIKADNPGVTLPSTTIQTFHRSDSSGTTYNFTNYLTNVAKSDWTYQFGKTWSAPGGQGAKGSAGVAQGVKSTSGGIGYFETSFATQGGLSIAKVGDAGGKFVEDTAANVTAFLSKATVAGSGDDLALKFDYTSADGSAYPISLVTYEITCTKGGKQAGLVKSFLSYTSSTTGQAVLPTAGYVQLPDNIVSQVQGVVAKIS